MLVSILILTAGLALIILGADILVEGASTVARRAGISEFVIGLAIVGIGTSMPEFVVSLSGALAGSGDIALGNVIGSNIFNTLLILGATALIYPIGTTPENRRRDIPMNILVTVLLLVLGLKQTLFGIGKDEMHVAEGLLLLALFMIYMYFCFKKGNKNVDNDNISVTSQKETEIQPKDNPLWAAILMILGGIAALAGGGRMFVDGAMQLARMIGVSDKFIAITILAGGTSLPELATCVAAALKKKDQLALGNIIGSNLFNILLILGSTALIHPLSFAGIGFVDAGVLLGSALLLGAALFLGKRNQLDRLDGALLLLCEAGYLTYLFATL